MIKILTVGKTKEATYSNEMDKYLKRIKKYARVDYVELPDVKGGGKLSMEDLKEAEASQFLKYIRNQDTVVLLDEKGKSYSSRSFSTKIESWQANTSGDLIFIIGGAYGFGSELKTRSDQKVSLSEMTLTHQMVRLFFIEQVYRSFTILNGEKYHHD